MSLKKNFRFARLKNRRQSFRIMDILKKLALPLIFILFSVILIYIGVTDDQNAQFIIASGVIGVIGIVALINALELTSKPISLGIGAVLIALTVWIGYMDFKSIKDPIDFNNEKIRRYTHVVQRLKDLRTAQLAYKTEKGVYANSLDTLLMFVKQDSFRVVKAVGFVPDSLTEEKALEMGIISRDTFKIAVFDSIYSLRYLASREEGVSFKYDSLKYVPFTGGTEFIVQAGTIERNNVTIPVFEIKDAKPFDKKDTMRVGSLTDPSTAGNWE